MGIAAGDLILVASTIVFSIYVVLMKKVADQYDSLTLNTLIFVPGAIMMLPFCTRAVVATRWSALSPKAWWGLGFMVVSGTVISYLALCPRDDGAGGLPRCRLQLFATRHRQRLGHLGTFRSV